MADTSAFQSSGRGQLDTLLDGFQREKVAVADQRKEIALLVKQAVAEIDRLSQRNRELSSQMRQFQSNIEAFSRAEIQQRHSAYQEAQMRLFMMQSQLEQLRGRQANLEKTEQLLTSFLETAALLNSPEGNPSSTDESSKSKTAQPMAEGTPGDNAMSSVELAYHRVSRELQDGSAQALSDLILRAEVCERLVKVDPQKAKEELVALRQATTTALKSTRQLVHELQPPALEELGLIAALRRYVGVSNPGNKLRVELQVAGPERRLSTGTELAVFRIIQEALLNAARHSDADRAEVKLRFEQEQVVVTVADEGRGFDVASALAEAAQRDSSGLTDMQLRARLIGANLEIGSKVGAGCMISLAIPV